MRHLSLPTVVSRAARPPSAAAARWTPRAAPLHIVRLRSQSTQASFQQKVDRWQRLDESLSAEHAAQTSQRVSRREQAQRSRANANKRIVLYGAGIAVCMAILWAYQPGNRGDSARLDAPQEVPKDIHGKPINVLEKPGPPGVKLVAGADIELIETGTSSVPHFPRTVHLPTASATSDEEEYSLLGLGIRSVSFLRVQVYVLGLYVRTSDLPKLQRALVQRINPIGSLLVPGEKDSLRNDLLDPETGVEAWNAILRDAGIRSAIRIVPTRGTDFNHLRDGWVRGITARVQDAAKKGSKEFDDEGFDAAMKDFKATFGGRGKAPKGSVVLLLRDEKGKLSVVFQDKDVKVDVGSVSDERIGRQIWLGYLAGKNVSSEPARQSVVEGVMELVGRPVGTVGVGGA